jgi:drug/metabolite transporter (DMT)-like permease
LPKKYLLGCGALFILYMLVFYLAVGLAKSHQQVLEVSLLNYLWPPLTIVFSLVLLGKRAGWLLGPGTLLALSGLFLVLTHGAEVSWHSVTGNIAGNPLAYGLGAIAGISWALYSTLTRRWADGARGGGVDLFLPATGVILCLLAVLVDGGRDWSLRAAAEVAFLGAVTYTAYGLWDAAMRRGNVVLVAAGSYLTPLVSTLISSLYLVVTPPASLWAGCGLLIAGSFLSWLSVSDASPAPPETPRQRRSNQ